MNYKYQQPILIYGLPLIPFLAIAALKALAVGNDFNNANFAIFISFIVAFLFFSLPYLLYQGLIGNLSSLKLKGFKEISKAYSKKLNVESIIDSINVEKDKFEKTFCKSDSLGNQIKLAIQCNAKKEQEKTEQLHEAILNYTIEVMSPHMDDENLTKLCDNVELYFSNKYPITKSVYTHGNLKPIDFKHFAWNIATRLNNYSGKSKATFAKNVFAIDLKESEISTIERTLREKGNCVIPIIELDDDSFNYYFMQQQFSIPEVKCA